MIAALRWQIALAAYAVFLKAMPQGNFKADYLRAVAGLRAMYPNPTHNPSKGD